MRTRGSDGEGKKKELLLSKKQGFNKSDTMQDSTMDGVQVMLFIQRAKAGLR